MASPVVLYIFFSISTTLVIKSVACSSVHPVILQKFHVIFKYASKFTHYMIDTWLYVIATIIIIIQPSTKNKKNVVKSDVKIGRIEVLRR